MILLLFVYFVLGAIQDIFITQYYLALSKRRAFLASVWGFVITVLTIWVIETIITSNQVGLLVVYAAGTGFGTYVGIQFNVHKRMNNEDK